MSKKDHKVAKLMEGIEAGEHDLHLVGYLRCFNTKQFYEAHDVLEALWLKDRNGPDGDFFKGRSAKMFTMATNNSVFPMELIDTPNS